MAKKKMLCAVINDGYTFDGETDASDTCPSIKFQFRPFSGLDRAEWVDREEKASFKEKAILRAEILADHLTGWDAQMPAEGGKYQEAPITEENVLAIDQVPFVQMFSILIGQEKRTAKMRKSDEPNTELEDEEKN